MSNPVGTKVNGTPQIPPIITPEQTEQKSPVSASKQEPQAPAMTEDAKSSMKTLHHFDGTAKEAKLRSQMNPLADPTKDGRQEWVKKMIKDGTLDSKEAQNVVNLAKDDSKLPQGEKDPKKLEPALINLYVRSGVPVDEARRLAGKTIEMSNDGKGSTSASTNAPKEKMTSEKADKIRTEAEDGTKGNAAADKKWTMDQIKQDRAGFMRNAVQIDGDKNTKADFKACAPTSLLGGMILSKPEAAQDLAKKLQTENGAKEFPRIAKRTSKERCSADGIRQLFHRVM